eukprot:600920-Heterocapsa_arctica.AAC.1
MWEKRRSISRTRTARSTSPRRQAWRSSFPIGTLAECVQLQSAADFIENKDMLCKTPRGCLLCKALADTHEHQTYKTAGADKVHGRVNGPEERRQEVDRGDNRQEADHGMLPPEPDPDEGREE